MAGQRGGRREGSGRHSTPTKYLKSTQAVVEKILPHLDDLIATQLREAFGGYEVVEEEYVRERGDGEGAGAMVLNKRKISRARPNLGALESLLNRAVGRPAQQLDLSLLEDKGGAMNMTPELAAKLRAVYAEHARVKLAVPGGEDGAD